MPVNVLPLVLKNLLRSKTRLVATVGCCLIAAAIVEFFVAAEHSLSGMMQAAGGNSVLVMTQKDRY